MPEPATLNCDIEPGKPPAEVKWYKGDQLLKPEKKKYEITTDKKGSHLKILNTDLPDGGRYTCDGNDR